MDEGEGGRERRSAKVGRGAAARVEQTNLLVDLRDVVFKLLLRLS